MAGGYLVAEEGGDFPMKPYRSGVPYVLALVLAATAVWALRGRRGYLPDWVRIVFGAKRTLHRRRELRPKPSPFQPEPLQRAH